MTLQTPSAPIVPPRKSGTSIINIVLALAVMVAIGGVAFGVGRLTAASTTPGAPVGGLGRAGFATTGATGASGARHRIARASALHDSGDATSARS